MWKVKRKLTIQCCYLCILLSIRYRYNINENLKKTVKRPTIIKLTNLISIDLKIGDAINTVPKLLILRITNSFNIITYDLSPYF